MQTYFGYEISGACFNPAIALAQFLGGNLGESKKDFKTLGLYILVEMLGGFAGAIIGYMPRPSGIFCPEPNPYFNMGEVMLNEFFWTTASHTWCLPRCSPKRRRASTTSVGLSV